MFRTIVAKYSGSTCKRCRGPIAVGTTIRYGGRGLTYHMAKYCGTTESHTMEPGYERFPHREEQRIYDYLETRFDS